MATEQEQRDFVNRVVAAGQNVYNQFYAQGKWILFSVCIGQACYESGYGLRGVCVSGADFNYWGMKQNQAFIDHGYTQYYTRPSDGARFVKFNSLQDAITAYYLKITEWQYSSYKKACNNPSVSDTIWQLLYGGWTTPSTGYVNSVINIVNKFDLTQYDRTTPPGPGPIPPGPVIPTHVKPKIPIFLIKRGR